MVSAGTERLWHGATENPRPGASTSGEVAGLTLSSHTLGWANVPCVLVPHLRTMPVAAHSPFDHLPSSLQAVTCLLSSTPYLPSSSATAPTFCAQHPSSWLTRSFYLLVTANKYTSAFIFVDFLASEAVDPFLKHYHSLSSTKPLSLGTFYSSSKTITVYEAPELYRHHKFLHLHTDQVNGDR